MPVPSVPSGFNPSVEESLIMETVSSKVASKLLMENVLPDIVNVPVVILV